jgi:hypothetical protein
MHRFFLPFLFAVAFTPSITQADPVHVSLRGAFGDGTAFSLSFEARNFTIDPTATGQSVPLENLALSFNGQLVQTASLDGVFGTNLLVTYPGGTTDIAAFNKPFIGENANGTQGQFLPGTYAVFGYVETNGVYNNFHHENTTLKITPIPEPSALSLVLVGGGLSLVGFHFRRGCATWWA